MHSAAYEWTWCFTTSSRRILVISLKIFGFHIHRVITREGIRRLRLKAIKFQNIILIFNRFFVTSSIWCLNHLFFVQILDIEFLLPIITCIIRG